LNWFDLRVLEKKEINEFYQQRRLEVVAIERACVSALVGRSEPLKTQ